MISDHDRLLIFALSSYVTTTAASSCCENRKSRPYNCIPSPGALYYPGTRPLLRPRPSQTFCTTPAGRRGHKIRGPTLTTGRSSTSTGADTAKFSTPSTTRMTQTSG
eukprot:120237-Rhodomonas_salina.1